MNKNNNSINLDPAELLLSGMCDFIKGSFNYEPDMDDTKKEKLEKLKEKLGERWEIYKLITPENLKKIIDRYETSGYKIDTETTRENISLDLIFAGFVLYSILYFQEELQLRFINELGDFKVYVFSGITTGLIKFLEAQNGLVKNAKAYEKFFVNTYDKLFDRDVMWDLRKKMNGRLPYDFGLIYISDLLRKLWFYPDRVYDLGNRLVAESSRFLDQLVAKIICELYKKGSNLLTSYVIEVLENNLSIDIACNLAGYGLTKARINDGNMNFQNLNLKEKYINAFKDCHKEIENYIMHEINTDFHNFWHKYIYNEICDYLSKIDLANWRDDINPAVNSVLDKILNIAGQVLVEMDYKSNLVDLLLNEPALFEKDFNFVKVLGPLVCLNRIDNKKVECYLRQLFKSGVDDDNNTIKRMVYVLNKIKLPDEKQKHVVEKLKKYGYDEKIYGVLSVGDSFSNNKHDPVPNQSKDPKAKVKDK